MKRLGTIAGIFTLALANLGTAIALSQQSPEHTAEADPLATERRLADSGALAESESLTREFLDKNPGSADAHFLLGYILFREQKAKDSLAEFTAGARTRHPSPADLKTVASDYVLLRDFSFIQRLLQRC